MKSEGDLWDTGKEDEISSSNSDDDSSTLDLSETSPEKDEKEINYQSGQDPLTEENKK